MSSIPIESVERIEIVRGGSSVLYGEGATGGTIQIITKRPQRNQLRGSVVAEVGSYGHKELRASLTKGWDRFLRSTRIASKQRADNYRANNAVDQGNFSGGLQWASTAGTQSACGCRCRAPEFAAGGAALRWRNSKRIPRQTLNPE